MRVLGSIGSDTLAGTLSFSDKKKKVKWGTDVYPFNSNYLRSLRHLFYG